VNAWARENRTLSVVVRFMKNLRLKRMGNSKPKSLPRFKSPRALVEFFETHDMGEYWDSMPEAHFDIEIKGAKQFVRARLQSCRSVGQQQRMGSFDSAGGATESSPPRQRWVCGPHKDKPRRGDRGKPGATPPVQSVIYQPTPKGSHSFSGRFDPFRVGLYYRFHFRGRCPRLSCLSPAGIVPRAPCKDVDPIDTGMFRR